MQKRGRVQVLPERLLPSSARPIEPSEPPPLPKNLVSLLIVGEANAGKSSLVNSFVSHEFRSEQECEPPQSDDNNNPQWSVAYTKKDVVFSNKSNCLQSVRVLIWDTSGLDPYTPVSNMEQATDWKQVWKKASKILLVLPLASGSWEETFQKIKDWKQWLDHNHPCCPQRQKPVVLMLHQGDRLVQSSSSSTTTCMEWIRVGKRIAELCRELQIHSWHITSSCRFPEEEEDGMGTVNSIDTAFRELLVGSKARSVPDTIIGQTATSGSHSVATTVPAAPSTVVTTPEKKSKTRDYGRVVSPLT